MKNKTKIIHIIVIILGIIFISLCAFHTSLWFDESYSVAIAKHSFSEIWTITGNDVHPALYYCSSYCRNFRIYTYKKRFWRKGTEYYFHS